MAPFVRAAAPLPGPVRVFSPITVLARHRLL